MQDTVALQFFDYYHAYCQSLDESKQYEFGGKIVFNQTPSEQYVNILVVNFQQCFQFRNDAQYQIILIDNCADSLEASSYMVLATIERNPRAYFLCGAQVPVSHPYADRIISYNTDISLFLDCLTRPFYPQYYEKAQSRYTERKSICFINGQNRTWRKYFLDCLNEICPGAIPTRNKLHTYGNHAIKLIDCAFESPEDEKFRKWINDHIINQDLNDKEQLHYYESSVPIGIEGKFGKVPPGYFVLEEYYQYHCVMYPEASWINDQLFMTEKSFKCFAAKAIPWVISGANWNSMAHANGFLTAIDLLPEQHQKFDSITDHRERYHAQCQAIKWAIENPAIWTSDRAWQIKQHNFEQLFLCNINISGLQKFHGLVEAVI